MRTLLNSIKVSIVAVITLVVASTTAFAQEYGCGAYGGGAYGVGDCGTGEVADTGMNVWLIRGLALIAIALAVYVVWRTAKKRKTKA